MQKYTNKGSVPWYPKESRTPCKNAVNDSTIASSISWWQGWHLFHCISPMSLQDGKKILTDKQQLATGFACSSRTVSPDEHCYRLICASCTQFHVPLGTQAFQLPQAASKQRSVPWCCRCGMFAAFTTAAIRLLRSIFIWAPLRTRPKFQHLCAHTRDSQRSRCSARRCNISRLPLSSKHVLCFWLFYFGWRGRMLHSHGHSRQQMKQRPQNVHKRHGCVTSTKHVAFRNSETYISVRLISKQCHDMLDFKTKLNGTKLNGTMIPVVFFRPLLMHFNENITYIFFVLYIT